MTKGTIGTSSLILLFSVLCLTAFAVLTLEAARLELLFTQKTAEAVLEYYRADAHGEAFVQEIDQMVLKGQRQKQSSFVKEIPMKSGLALRVELVPEWKQKLVLVQEWSVYERERMEIDQSIPVWNGVVNGNDKNGRITENSCGKRCSRSVLDVWYAFFLSDRRRDSV